jgi:glycosyltransferase involved in cell wall biosynthesis
MRPNVLLVHNHYRSTLPSGEGIVVEGESRLLRDNGHKVEGYFRNSDEILDKRVTGVIAGAFATPWNPWSAKGVKIKIDNFKPDVVHVHNTFPLISPAIFRSIGLKSAKVLTLHNYRLFCAAAIPMRKGKICTECMTSGSALPALRYGCYRNSRLATFPIATSVALHRKLGTWVNHVDAFIALSNFQRDLLISSGLPAGLVHVKPNFYPGKPRVVPWSKRKKCVVFAGRLTAEKGVESLVKAWLDWGPSAPELRILGDGDLKKQLVQLASSSPNVPIRFLGQLPGVEAEKEIASSHLLILPSECFEGFPMVVREAFAFGTPVAVSDIGPLPSIVHHGKNGLVFHAGNSCSLLDTVQAAWKSTGMLEELGGGARRSFEALYNETANYELLMDIYREAASVNEYRKSR